MKPLTRNILSLSGAELVSRFLAFVAVAYLARKLGPASMGILAVGMAILTYASIFADAGLPLLGTRQVAGQGNVSGSFMRKLLSTRFLLSGAVLLVAGGIIQLIIDDAATRKVAAVYLVSLLPSALLLDWLFQGLGRMVTLSVGRIVAMATYLICVVGLVNGPAQLILVPIGWIAGIGAHVAYMGLAYGKLPGNVRSADPAPQNRARLIRMGIPLGLANLMAQIVIQFPFLYLGFSISREDAGIYSVAFRGIVLMLILDRVFYTLFFPSIRKSFARGVDHLRKRFQQTLKLIITGGFYLAILAVLAADTVFPFVFGSQFTRSGLVFQLLVPFFVLSLVNSVFTFTLIATENEVSYSRSLAAGALGFFAVLLLPIPVDAVVQVTVALTGFQTVSLVAMLRRMREIIPVDVFRSLLLPTLTSIVLTGILTVWQHHLPVIATVLALVAALPILGWSAGIQRKDLLDLGRSLI
ncbi:MAG: oligosaccharide flippase family protein [Fidelibacterota bacterium]